LATAPMDGTYQPPLRIQQSSPPPPRPLLFFRLWSMPVCTGARREHPRRPLPLPRPGAATALRPAERFGFPAIGCTPLHVLACLIILSGTLSGCAAYSAYRKCGSGGCPGDARITAEVRALLTQQPALQPPNQVYVQTLDGVVYLTGLVATDLHGDTAESAAHEASGVSRIVNTIALN